MKVWGSMTASTRLTEPFHQQKACLWINGKVKHNAHTDPLLKKLKVLKLRDMIDLELCKLGHQLKNKQLPMPILSLFNSRGGQKSHRYPTRGKDLPNIQTHTENKFNQFFMSEHNKL